MSVYNVDNEGVSALNNAANQVSESCEALMKLLGSLTNAAGDNPEGLGPHTAELAAAIKKTRAAVENSKAPAETVSGSLRALAQSYQDIIDNNPFTAFEKSNAVISGLSTEKQTEEIEYAVFEIEAFKKGLDLGKGDENYPQIGGIYGEMDSISGFERHHIPSNAVQDESKAKLPAILISSEDHKKTDSYAGKQNSKHASLLPDTPDFPAYKTVVANEISNGNYVGVVKAEIYNIIDKCGHRYDGAISSYLDALTDYIKKNGVPKPIFGKK